MKKKNIFFTSNVPPVKTVFFYLFIYLFFSPFISLLPTTTTTTAKAITKTIRRESVLLLVACLLMMLKETDQTYWSNVRSFVLSFIWSDGWSFVPSIYPCEGRLVFKYILLLFYSVFLYNFYVFVNIVNFFFYVNLYSFVIVGVVVAHFDCGACLCVSFYDFLHFPKITKTKTKTWKKKKNRKSIACSSLCRFIHLLRVLDLFNYWHSLICLRNKKKILFADQQKKKIFFLFCFILTLFDFLFINKTLLSTSIRFL